MLWEKSEFNLNMIGIDLTYAGNFHGIHKKTTRREYVYILLYYNDLKGRLP